MSNEPSQASRGSGQPGERTLDVLWGATQQAISAGLLICMSPVLGAIAIAIRLDSPGDIIFKQRRPGWRGQQFTALKFRSMRTDSERTTRLGVSAGDSRITRVGAVLRATKLDELPQLWNIATGEMRFVGPRPLPIALDDALRSAIPGFEQRYQVRPGLTSLAQVCVHDNGLDERLVQDWSLRFEAERRYIRNRCMGYDVLVILLTAVYVIRKAITR